MLEWFQNIANSWPMIFVYGLTDYLTTSFTGPLLASGGMAGAYLNSGLNFSAKLAASQTSYFSGMAGSVGGYFGSKK